MSLDATDLVRAYREAGLTIATAESCTGGLVAAALTDVPGSSAVMERGFVTYSNLAKTELLGVSPALIHADGAVSRSVAREMAEGALRRSEADVAVAVTGIAGPDGGSAEKPVGLVHFACAVRDREDTVLARHVFSGSRAEVRQSAVAQALAMLEAALTEL